MQTVIDWFEELGMEKVTGSVVMYGEGNDVTTVRGYSKS
jgi:hypothetical protein